MYLFSSKYLWPLMGNSPSSSPPKWPLAVQWVRLTFTTHRVQVPSLVGELRSHMHNQIFFFFNPVVLGKICSDWLVRALQSGISTWTLPGKPGWGKVKVKVAQSCPTLCNPMDYTVHEILQDRILEWVAFSFSRGSSQPRDWTQVPHIVGRFFTSWATREAQEYWSRYPIPSPGDLPDPRIELGSPALQADSLPTELSGKGCSERSEHSLPLAYFSYSIWL